MSPDSVIPPYPIVQQGVIDAGLGCEPLRHPFPAGCDFKNRSLNSELNRR
jgi:hypothetical protein